MTRILGLVLLAATVVAPAAFADQPRRLALPMRLPPLTTPSPAVNSHTVFLNNCMPSGCTVHPGSTSSVTDTFDYANGLSTLSAYPYGSTKWNSVVSCVKSLMSPFNITVTDTRPSGNYFEVMAAGSACDVLASGDCNGVGGVADYNCQAPGECSGTYFPNALVFDFAESWGGDVNEDCATIGQEIAHAWNLDHVDLPDDPMTYDNLVTPLSYHNAAPCGSDCLYTCSGGGTCNAFNVKCTSNRHACMSTGTATQDEIKIITALFGASNAKPPVLTITSPANNSAQAAGFAIDTTCTESDGSGIESVAMTVDGGAGPTLTTAPYNFSTNAGLSNGTHNFQITCTAGNQQTAVQNLTIIVGVTCSTDSDCPTNDVCYQGACIAGSGTPGGLGSPCTTSADCLDGQCASDGTESVCVIPCNLSSGSCPSGFGCVSDGSGTDGVCFPGSETGASGNAGCDAGGSPAGPMLLGLGVVVLVISRRRPRADARR
jgi:hypothetical protein